jgi:hypothetical protein
MANPYWREEKRPGYGLESQFEARRSGSENRSKLTLAEKAPSVALGETELYSVKPHAIKA